MFSFNFLEKNIQLFLIAGANTEVSVVDAQYRVSESFLLPYKSLGTSLDSQEILYHLQITMLCLLLYRSRNKVLNDKRNYHSKISLDLSVCPYFSTTPRSLEYTYAPWPLHVAHSWVESIGPLWRRRI